MTAAFQLIARDRAARPEAYAQAGGARKRWLALGMRLGGVVLLGFLIPIIIYFVTVYKSQKASEQEVGAALQALVSGAPQYPQQGYPQQQHMHM